MIDRETFAVRWTPSRGPTRKIVFEPRNIGSYDQEPNERRNDEWRCTEQEIVAHVELETVRGITTNK